MSSPRTLTAYHEAGHAVAALMRGGSSLLSVTLSDTHGAGITWHRSHVWDQAFIAYAGPWAESRHQWGDRPLDDLDDDGFTFDDVVAGCLLVGGADDATAIDRGLSIEAIAAEMGGSADDPGIADQLRPTAAARESVWQIELHRVWTAICEVAARLVAGQTVTSAEVDSYLRRCQS